MGTILALAFIAVGILIIYYIYAYFAGMKVVSTDTEYRQRGVTVNYPEGTMKFRGHIFPVKEITGVSLVTNQNGNRKSYHVLIEIDSIRKPTCRVPVIGSQTQADSFIQRICVAIRKAGGRDFH